MFVRQHNALLAGRLFSLLIEVGGMLQIRLTCRRGSSSVRSTVIVALAQHPPAFATSQPLCSLASRIHTDSDGTDRSYSFYQYIKSSSTGTGRHTLFPHVGCMIQPCSANFHCLFPIVSSPPNKLDLIIPYNFLYPMSSTQRAIPQHVLGTEYDLQSQPLILSGAM